MENGEKGYEKKEHGEIVKQENRKIENMKQQEI